MRKAACAILLLALVCAVALSACAAFGTESQEPEIPDVPSNGADGGDQSDDKGNEPPSKGNGVCAHVREYDNVVVPTCTESGLSGGWHCAECGEILLKQDYLVPLGHDWVYTVGPASTCISRGKVDRFVCSRKSCGMVSFDTVTAADIFDIVADLAPHSWGEAVEARADGCIVIRAHRACTVCDAYLDIEKTEESGTEVIVESADIFTHQHAWDMDRRVFLKVPTCTEGGAAIDVCTYCSKSEEHILAPTEHDELAHVKTVYPTCDQDGYLVYRCSQCRSPSTEVILSVSDITPEHDGWQNLSALDLTKCGHSIDGVTPLHHPATCIEPGYDLYKCTRHGVDGCSYTVRIYEDESGAPLYPALGHTPLDDGICSACGKRVK